MLSPSDLIAAVAAAIGVTAAVADIREGRIPNRLTYPAMVAGLAMHVAMQGWKGLQQALVGGLFFGGVFLGFYVVRAMGAGDVKLATALGCVVGFSASVHVLYATAISGGVLAIVQMLRSGRVVETLRNTLSVVGFHARHGLRVHPLVNLENPRAARMPYGVAFAAGTVYWALSSLFWR